MPRPTNQRPRQESLAAVQRGAKHIRVAGATTSAARAAIHMRGYEAISTERWVFARGRDLTSISPRFRHPRSYAVEYGRSTSPTCNGSKTEHGFVKIKARPKNFRVGRISPVSDWARPGRHDSATASLSSRRCARKTWGRQKAHELVARPGPQGIHTALQGPG